MDNPRLNIIFDNRRIEKFDPLIDELRRQGIDNYEIWQCICDKGVVESINASHKMIVQYAKDNNLDEIIIAEDDLWFPATDGWRYYLASMPKEFDIYLGGNYLPFDVLTKTCTDIVGLHLYTIRSCFYDQFLALPNKQHIDQALKNKSLYDVCYPMAALQREGFSSNNMRPVNYNSQINWEDVYT